MQKNYVDVDAAMIALGAALGPEVQYDRPDVPNVDSGKDMQDVFAAATNAGEYGVLKRLLAALYGAYSRGGVEFTAERIGNLRQEEAGAATDTVARVRITITSDGGTWTSRTYRMVTVATVTEDDYGSHRWTTGRGCAYVTSNHDQEDGTLFGGYAVGAAIAHLYFTRGVGRNEIARLTTPAPKPTTSTWQDHALRGIAQVVDEFAAVFGDQTGAAQLTRYLAGNGMVAPSTQATALALAEITLRLGTRHDTSGGNFNAICDAWIDWKGSPTGDLGEAMVKAIGDGPRISALYEDLGDVLISSFASALEAMDQSA